MRFPHPVIGIISKPDNHLSLHYRENLWFSNGIAKIINRSLSSAPPVTGFRPVLFPESWLFPVPPPIQGLPVMGTLPPVLLALHPDIGFLPWHTGSRFSPGDGVPLGGSPRGMHLSPAYGRFEFSMNNLDINSKFNWVLLNLILIWNILAVVTKVVP